MTNIASRSRVVLIAAVWKISAAAALAQATGNPVVFTPLTPCRVVDTRNPNGPYGGPKFAGGQSRNFDLNSSSTCTGIPNNVFAYSVNFTVTQTDGPGFLIVYPTGGSQPLASTINYVAGETLANAATVAAGTDGSITVVAGVSGTHLIIDINGYFTMAGTLNPLRVATLQWHEANQTGLSFAVGTLMGDPEGLAFDGANIWVANRLSNNVTKLRASDGANLGTFAAGNGPVELAFDGANMWVTNNNGSNVTKLRATDGFGLGTFALGGPPQGVAFDGANIWVAIQSGGVTKLRASDGANLGTFAAGTTPRSVAFDGANIWVTNAFSNNVTKLRASDGTNLGTFPAGTSPFGIAFDGANIWVANNISNDVTKLRASDGAALGTFPLGGTPFGPSYVVFDGANIWISNSERAIKLRASDGANLGTFIPVSGDTSAAGMAFDGANIWVASANSRKVSKL
jgi:hypothetical protein